MHSPAPQEPSILAGANRAVRKSLVVAPEGYREAVEAQQAAVKALESRVEAQQQREEELFGRVKLLTEKLAEAQAVAAVQVQVGGGGKKETRDGCEGGELWCIG